MTGPPRVRWTFHGTAAVRSYTEALTWLGRFCGCRALEYSDNRDPLVARKGGVTWIGDAGLELMEPTLPEGGPARYLERFGPGMYALALQVEDVHEAAAWLDAREAGIVGDLGRGYFFTRPQHTCSVYLEWADEPWSFDPRFGAALPPAPDSLIDVPRVAWWGALVADPAAALARLQELWPAAVLSEEHETDPRRPAATLSLEDGVLALYPLPRDASALERLWGPGLFRPRLHLMALRVRDLEATGQTLEAEGIRVLRGDAAAGELITHPDDTHGIPLAWTDRDLPGDPRGPLS